MTGHNYYDGHPPSHYAYTGSEPEQFAKWRSGEYTTKQFKTRTSMGQGTAALELKPEHRSSTSSPGSSSGGGTTSDASSSSSSDSSSTASSGSRTEPAPPSSNEASLGPALFLAAVVGAAYVLLGGDE